MITHTIQNAEPKIVLHYTHEIIRLFDSKLNVLVTMNVTRSLAKHACDPNKTIAFFVSCSRDIADLCRERYFMHHTHLKLYQTDTRLIISTANLSLSKWIELSVVLTRTKPLDDLVNSYINFLKRNHASARLAPTFKVAFH